MRLPMRHAHNFFGARKSRRAFLQVGLLSCVAPRSLLGVNQQDPVIWSKELHLAGL